MAKGTKTKTAGDAAPPQQLRSRYY